MRPMSVPARLVLASTSRYRRELLARMGLPVEAVAPGVDEDLPPGLPVVRAAALLAERKARAVASRPEHVEDLVIGSDQICLGPDGRILSKPGTLDRAREQLGALAGRAHRLVTAVAVMRADRLEVAVDVHTLHMWPLDADEIDRYLAHDAPFDCAGSYRLEALGLALFSRITADPESADETAVIGLPVMKTLRILRESFGWTPWPRPPSAP